MPILRNWPFCILISLFLVEKWRKMENGTLGGNGLSTQRIGGDNTKRKQLSLYRRRLPPSPAPVIFFDAVRLPPRHHHHLRRLPPSLAIAHSLCIALSLSLTLSPATAQICRSEVCRICGHRLLPSPPDLAGFVATGFGVFQMKREYEKKNWW